MDELLTPRQVQVLEGLADGLTFREIAARLYLSPTTCSNNAVEAYRRLGVNTAHGAVGEGYRRGILRIEEVADDPRDLVTGRARVRIFSGAIGCSDHVMAEGEVIGYCEHPTLMLRHDDGTRSSWSVTLPREVLASPGRLAGLASIAGAAVCTCPGVAAVHVQGVAGCG